MKLVKKLLAVVGVFLLLAAMAASYVVLTTPTTSAQGVTASESPIRVDATNADVTAKGRVVPANSVELRFRAKGNATELPIAMVAVRPGDYVEKGAILARLDTRDLELQVAEAQATLDAARIHLLQLPIESQTTHMRSEAEILNIEGEASAARIKAEAEASKLRADANVARLFGRTTAASGLEASADGLLQAATTLQGNALAYRDRLADALASERRNDPTNVAAAMARVREAEAALERARLAVEMATLHAPFAGTVVTVRYKVGEMPGITDAGIILSDISHLQIEVSNLAENDLGRVAVGSPVNVVFDAVGATIPGKVDYISPVGTFAPGTFDSTYRVLIELDRQDALLRSDMSAAVTFLPATVSAK